MKSLLKRDFIAGIACLVIAAFVVWYGQDYSYGNLNNMGPGYLPRILGIALSICGILTILGAINSMERVPRINVRALVFVTLGILTFAFTMNRIGMLPATFLLIHISALSESPYRIFRTLALSLSLCLLSYLIFIFGLNMPIRLHPWSF
ncbi:tripartite tricarboxylate transporter TctB family protein [Halotalea alkalilenta]|uniref:tripartite tricarboxylate transporter TctB family protein n=1 Tax=Halotalea alkalilenta TaxID=376489 RepID=UPI0009DDB30E|nr:tripartite tricarboxylate transporter TctB family protein [Halotalea alkalilenta]